MELLVKVGSTDSSQLQYQDGDIVEAYSQSQIELGHAYRLCHHKTVGLDSVSGLRPVNSLPYLFAEIVSKYKFERISQTEVRRTNYATGEIDIVGATPNANGERINVSLYISKRTSRSSHRIYGQTGSEIWFGELLSDVDLDAVWNVIETHSDNLRSSYQSWNYTPLEKLGFLPINCVGFRNDEVTVVSTPTVSERSAELSTEPEDESSEPQRLAKRKFFVPYWDIANQLNINVDDVRNTSKPVDARSEAPLSERSHLDDVHTDKITQGIITV